MPLQKQRCLKSHVIVQSEDKEIQFTLLYVKVRIRTYIDVDISVFIAEDDADPPNLFI